MITDRERREAMLALSLWKKCGVDIFRGITEGDEPKRRMRAAIAIHSLQSATVGKRKDGSQVSFADAFAETYGEPGSLPSEKAA